MFGSHLSIAGGMENAIIEAQTLYMGTVEVFSFASRPRETNLSGEF